MILFHNGKNAVEFRLQRLGFFRRDVFTELAFMAFLELFPGSAKARVIPGPGSEGIFNT